MDQRNPTIEHPGYQKFYTQMLHLQVFASLRGDDSGSFCYFINAVYVEISLKFTTNFSV